MFNEHPDVHKTYFGHMTLENVDRIQAHGVVVLKALDLLVTCLKKDQDRKLVKTIQGVSLIFPLVISLLLYLHFLNLISGG